MTKDEFLSQVKYKITEGTSNKMLLILTGIAGSLAGYGNKYEIIANDVKSKFNVSTMVVALPYEAWQYLSNIFDYAMDIITHYFEFRNIEDFSVYVMGTSAGGSAALTYSAEYPCIKKVAVVNPVFNVNSQRIFNNLDKKNIKYTVILGEKDLSIFDLNNLYEHKLVNTVVIPGGDHYLSGEENFEYFLQIPRQYLFNTLKQDDR